MSLLLQLQSPQSHMQFLTKMNIQGEFLKKAVDNLVESYEHGLALMKTIKLKYNECKDVQFVERNIGIIRSNVRQNVKFKRKMSET